MLLTMRTALRVDGKPEWIYATRCWRDLHKGNKDTKDAEKQLWPGDSPVQPCFSFLAQAKILKN